MLTQKTNIHQSTKVSQVLAKEQVKTKLSASKEVHNQNYQEKLDRGYKKKVI